MANKQKTGRSDRVVFTSLTPKLKAALKAKADKEGRTMSRQIARAVERDLAA